MATGPQAFYKLWQEDRIREIFFDLLSKEDICNVRVSSSACCNLVTKRLFLRTHLTFTANTFTRQCRIEALSRIGHHIEHLTFYFPHSDSTFLPPLIHPESGREISFLYAPHTSMASVLARPKYANTELGEILTQQYPPLFHAASNVPSFINAMKHVPNMRHLTIKTPGQDAKERYRRDIVDYALISLRVSLERAPLKKLTKLSLSSVHPSAFLYLRHVPGFGCTPSAGRRWRQIRKLNIAAESWDFYGPSPGLDHLKMIDDFIRNFETCLEKFTFTWLGRKGPCPLSLAADPLFAPPRSSKKLFNEVTSPMSPLPPAPARKPIFFHKVRYLSVRNATMNAPQVANLVAAHRPTVREFDFENVVLIHSGDWDDALAPLTEGKLHGERWTRHSTGSIEGDMTPQSGPMPGDDVQSPSAAVEAVSQELLDVDLNEGEEYTGEEYTGEAAVEENLDEEEAAEDDGGLASDIEAAKKASLSFSTKLKRRRITKRRRRKRSSHEHDHSGDQELEEDSRAHSRNQSKDSVDQYQPPPRTPEPRRKLSKASIDRSQAATPSAPMLRRHPSSSSSSWSVSRRQQHHYSREELDLGSVPELSPPRHYPSRHRLFGELQAGSSNASRSSQRLFGEVSEEPDLDLTSSPTDEAGSIDEYFRPPTPTMVSGMADLDLNQDMNISAPILNTQPSMPALLQPTVYDPTAELCHEISAVQRDIEAEETHRLLAEDVAMRTSALKKAKEAVLSKLSKQFYNASSPTPERGSNASSAGIPALGRKDSNASAHVPALLAHHAIGMRFREGLFGKGHSVASSAHREHMSLDSQSALVPILISR